MRAPIAVAVFCLLVAACSASSPDSAAISSTTTSAASTVSPGIPELLSDSEIKDVVVGDRTLRLAIADSPSLRSTGLMGVTGLESLDGMLFYWRHEASGGFWMKDTLIPLDIVWFDADGSFVGRASMVPCVADPCEVYSPADGVDYRLAIEANPGDLDWVTPDTVLIYSD
jgi:uncharacterized membrane protein (UPF0127 family)